MHSRRAATLISIAAVSATAGLALPALSAARRAAPTTYLTGDCVHPTVRPTSAVLFCGDGNEFFTGLAHWSNWGTKVANAHGTLNVNSCTPNCAAGKPLKATAVLTVLDPKPCGASHRRQYTKYEVTVLGTPPKGVQPNSNGSFLCR